MTTAESEKKRSRHLAFRCPECGNGNTNPRVGETEGRTPVAICDQCGQNVSAHLIADAHDRAARARADAIRKWAGWDETPEERAPS